MIVKYEFTIVLSNMSMFQGYDICTKAQNLQKNVTNPMKNV